MRVELSKSAQLLNQMSELAKAQPDKFKSATEQIAEQLQSAAVQRSGPFASALRELASRFSAASQTGRADDLFAPEASQTPGPRTKSNAASSGGAGGSSAHGAFGVAETMMSTALAAVTGTSGSASGKSTTTG